MSLKVTWQKHKMYSAKSLYLPSCISDLSSPFCLLKEEVKLYFQERVEVGEKWVWDLRRDQFWNRLCDGNTWKSMKIIKGLQIGSKGPFDARQHDLEMNQLCKILWYFLSAGKPRDRYIITFPVRCLEGLQKKVISSLKLVLRGQLLLIKDKRKIYWEVVGLPMK